MNNIRKAAKNVIAGDLFYASHNSHDVALYEARANVRVVKGMAVIPARLAHVGRGRLHNLQFVPGQQVALAKVGDEIVYAA